MIHVHYFITRKPSVPDAEFHRYWREVHGPIVRRISQLRRYVQSHRVPYPDQKCAYDGAAEVWVDDLAALGEIQRSSAYRDGALADEPNFIDMTRTEWLTTRDHVFIPGPAPADGVKMLFLLKRQPGFTIEQGRRYWLDVHGPIVAALPGLRRYVQCHTVEEAYRYAEPRWDGVAQLWFDSVDALRATVTSPQFTDIAYADTAKFVNMDTIESFVAREYPMIG